MTKKPLVALSAGHTLKTAGKRTPPIKELYNRVVHEHEFNRACINKIMQGLGRCGIDYLDVTPNSNAKNEDLYGRVKRANEANCDIFVAVHYNAFDSKFDEPDSPDPDGIEIYYCPGSIKGKKLAKSIYKYMQQGTQQKSRGVKSANYFVLKNTFMPAVLSENGFMDDKREAMLMLDENFITECAEEHVKGICDYFGIAYIEPELESDPDWVRILKDKTSHPDGWIKFVEESKDHPTGQYLPELIVKLAK